MSTRQRRIGLSVGLVALLLVVTGVWLLGSLGGGGGFMGLNSFSPVAQAAGEVVALEAAGAGHPGAAPGAAAEAVEPSVWSRLRELRQEQGLTPIDLAAAGLDEAASETALRRLKDQVEAQRATLAAVDQQVRQAEARLAATYRRIHVGPRDQAVLGAERV